MVENKKVVIVGIPGVGKTTLLTRVVEILEGQNKKVSVFSFGSLMFEVAQENGIHDRDELRKLPVDEQKKLQQIAAEKLASKQDEIVIIDTHAFISSTEGYYPGLPEHVLKIIQPTNFVSVYAKPEEIFSRRMNDLTRNRDKITLENVKKELDFQSAFISACAVISGSPIKYVLNREGKIEEAADKIINTIGL